MRVCEESLPGRLPSSGLIAASHVPVRPLVNYPRNAQPCVRPESPEERRGLRPVLELERLLGAFGNAERCATPVIPRVDIRPMLDEILHDLVPPAQCRGVESRIVRFVGRVHV